MNVNFRRMSTFCAIVALMTSLFLLSSCKDDDPKEEAYLTVSEQPVSISPAGGTANVAVDTNTDDWTHSITGGDGWLTGTKTARAVVLTATANGLSTGKRTATLTVTSAKAKLTRTVTVEQETSFEPFLLVEQADVEIPLEGGDVVVTVQTNTDDWTFAFQEGGTGWLTGEKTATGVKLTASANNTGTDRTAKLVISSAMGGLSRTVDVKQFTFIPSLVLSPEGAVTLSYVGGEPTTITVTTNVSDWTVAKTQGWLTVERTGSTVTISATANPGGVDRSDVLSFTSASFPQVNKDVQVTQTGSYVNADWSLLMDNGDFDTHNMIFTDHNGYYRIERAEGDEAYFWIFVPRIMYEFLGVSTKRMITFEYQTQTTMSANNGYWFYGGPEKWDGLTAILTGNDYEATAGGIDPANETKWTPYQLNLQGANDNGWWKGFVRVICNAEPGTVMLIRNIEFVLVR